MCRQLWNEFSIIPGKTPCLNCLLRTIPMVALTCDTGGIISPAVQMVIAHQSAEALKMLVEDWAPFEHRLSALTYGATNIRV